MFTTVAYTAALALAAVSQPATAIDYVGGWIPTPPKQQCVDICVNSKATPTCLTNDPACLAKKQRPGDFDWMVLEQLFVPQFCRDLLKGTDSTISHQNVNPYPNGVTCQPQVVKPELTIHGLWPNYNDGFLGCCNVTDTILNHPYVPTDFAYKHPSLLWEMKRKWVDPTQANEFDTLCEIYNHEFQKHGLCYAAFGNDYDKAAVNYFRAALNVAGLLDQGTYTINWWAWSQQSPMVADIQALYSKKVQVFCSNVDGVNRFSAIRSCWAKPQFANAWGPFMQIDCKEPTKSAAFIPCDPTQPISLDDYEAP